MRYRSTIGAALAAFLMAGALIGTTSAQPIPASTAVPAPVASGKATPVASPTPAPFPTGDEQMPYDRFTEGATSQIGLFTVWRKQGQLYLELSADPLDKPYLLAPELASGLGGGDFFAGLDFDPILLAFHRNGATIYTTEQNPHATAHPGSPAARAVELSYPQSVMNADPITSIRPDNGDIVFAPSAFLTDLVDLTDVLNPQGI